MSPCPGQDRRFWKPDDVFEEPCPHCGRAVEFWKDDPRRRCAHCGHLVRNSRFDMGCAAWCAFADRCLGAGAAALEAALCRTLIEEMKKVFGRDRRRIDHAQQVLDWAERILQREAADPLVVVAAAVLHDVGIPAAQRKHGSTAGRYQQIEGPPVARRILQAAGVDPHRTDHVCRIIADHHSARTMDTPAFRILWDADNLVNLFAGARRPPADDAEALARRLFKTPTGRALALDRLRRGAGAD
jgi:hypothetical protein